MSTLLVEPLVTELEQSFAFNLEGRSILAGVYPYLYMHNAPAGTFTFTVYEGEVTVLSTSFDSDDIKSSLETTNGYAHVYYPVTPSNPLPVSKGNYRAVLSASGYTHSGSSFIGWIREHENIREEMDYTPTSDAQNPLSVRRKIYKQGIL